MKNDNTGVVQSLDKAHERTFDLHNGINELLMHRDQLI